MGIDKIKRIILEPGRMQQCTLIRSVPCTSCIPSGVSKSVSLARSSDHGRPSSSR